MMMEDVYLNFRGFTPSSFLKSYLKSVMEELHGEAPYGASLSTVLSYHEGRFKGIVSIHSSAGRFIAVAKDTDPKAVIRKLLEQMRRRLGRWKAKRFRGGSLKEFSRELISRTKSEEVRHDTDIVA